MSNRTLLELQAPRTRPEPPAWRERHWIFQFCLVVVAALLYITYSASGPASQSGTYSNIDQQGGAAFASAGTHLDHAPPKESLARPFTAPPPSNTKDRSTGVPALIRASERAVGTATAQVAFVDRQVLLALRRCDLLFPFHIFW